MSEAVFVSGLGMWISLGGIAVIGLVGGALLVYCEKLAAKNRPAH
ncbi:hypothetical protein [Agaribacterium haliotis]|nr:hypothetical protein [Agaribacterium haliotis]